MPRLRVIRMRALPALLLAAALIACARVPSAFSSEPAASSEAGLGGYQPYTTWRRPTLALPEAEQRPDFLRDAERALRASRRWRRHGWLCEYLGCRGPYPMATLWGSVGLFETADALALADPSRAHRRAVGYYASESERFWDPDASGYEPYPEGNSPLYFDDNGWEGLAYLEAYRATHRGRWLRDAQRAFRFIAERGWATRFGGGIWWNTSHAYLSGPSLAADTLLGTLLYYTDHRRWQLRDVLAYLYWANTFDDRDGTELYLERPHGDVAQDYIEAPLIYAQYLLCIHGQGEEPCERSGRVAATLAEEDIRGENGENEYEYNYGPQYDAIFMQWMLAYGAATHVSFWRELARVNGEAAARHAFRRKGTALGSWWGGRIETSETKPGMLMTDGATGSLFAWLAYYHA